MSFIELTGHPSEQAIHVCIDHITCVYKEGDHTVVGLLDREIHVVESPRIITRQVHFLQKDTWTEVKHQAVVDLINKYGFEEGNRRYIEGEEKQFEAGLHPAGDKLR
jgi:hypothetical protein